MKTHRIVESNALFNFGFAIQISLNLEFFLSFSSHSHLAELEQLLKELHQKVCVLEEEVYDWEIKIRKQDFEVSNSFLMWSMDKL